MSRVGLSKRTRFEVFKRDQFTCQYAVEEAAELALARKPHSESQRFRYFCGVCWNKIRDGAE